MRWRLEHIGFIVLTGLVIVGLMMGRIGLAEAVTLIGILSSALLGKEVWQRRASIKKKLRGK